MGIDKGINMISRMMKLGSFGLLAGLGLGLAGCDSTSGPNPEGELVGKWEFAEARIKSVSTTTPVSVEYPDFISEDSNDVSGMGYLFEFKADHSFTGEFPSPYKAAKTSRTMTSLATSYSGKWSVKEDILLLIAPGAEGEVATEDTSRYTRKVIGTSMLLTEEVAYSSIDEAGYTTRTVETLTYKMIRE
jgi:hypothetical protein